LTKKVYLIGAGPGAPDLITLKGFEYLKKAKIVLYDALVNNEILDFCSSECKLINLGKKHGDIITKQATINTLMLEAVNIYGEVVRLKGGDPSVFGRLSEEIIFLKENKIDYEIVPGISSSIGVLTDNLIPLTIRGVNESFIISTATKPINELEEDIRHCIQHNAFLILLMSMGKLNVIENLFEKYNSKNTDAVIIEKGTTIKQRLKFCTVAELSEVAKVFSFKNPSIIAIGSVIKHLNQLGYIKKLQMRFDGTGKS